MIFSRSDETLRLEKLKNGFSVSYNYEESKTDESETEYKSDVYAFPTLEEAIAKLTELAGQLK